MKRFLGIMILVALIAISAPSTAHSDYIPPDPSAPPIIEIIEVPRQVLASNVVNLLLVTDTFKDSTVMVNVALAESSFNSTAKNPTSSASGIFQILKSTWVQNDCVGNILNAQDNIACAKKIYDISGTTPWTASKAMWSSK